VKLARDTWLVFQRQMTLLLRSKIWIIIGLAQPITYVLFFTPFLKPALASMGVKDYGDAFRVYVPGLLMAMACFGGLWAGLGLLGELRAGIVERTRVTQVSRTAMLLGRALRDVVNMLIQALIITLIALPFGLKVGLADLLLAYVLLFLAGLMATAISYDIVLLVRNEGALGPTINTISQPISLLAGVLLPLALAPVWMRNIALWNPFAWATNGMRALFDGHIGDPVVWQGVTIIGVVTLATVVLSARLFNKEIR
jgi:ABC-2 type transport system permease protein